MILFLLSSTIFAKTLISHSLSFDMQRGNTESLSARQENLFKYEKKSNSFEFKNEYESTQVDDSSSLEKWLFESTYSYAFNERYKLTTSVNVSSNRQKKIKRKYFYAIGPEEIFSLTKNTSLVLGQSFSAIIEDRLDQENERILSWYLDFKLKTIINEKSFLEISQKITNMNRGRYINESSIKLKYFITEILGLEEKFTYTHDSRPLKGVKSDDRSLSLLLLAEY